MTSSKPSVSMPGDVEHTDATPVYYHDCPMFGKHTRVPRALMADKDGEYILCYQHKCLCNYTVGDIEYAPGVTPTPTGYDVNTAIAEKLRGV